jgi:hypothetical protein
MRSYLEKRKGLMEDWARFDPRQNNGQHVSKDNVTLIFGDSRNG